MNYVRVKLTMKRHPINKVEVEYPMTLEGKKAAADLLGHFLGTSTDPNGSSDENDDNGKG